MDVFRTFLPRATQGGAMSVPLLSHYKKNLVQGFERVAVPLAPRFFRCSTRRSL